MTTETPECPTCGAPMQLRMARRGKNAGNQFWGCSRYPQCKGTRSADLDSQQPHTGSPTTARAGSSPSHDPLFTSDTDRRIPVRWDDRVARRAWISEYAAVASIPTVFSPPTLERRLQLEHGTQIALLLRRSPTNIPDERQQFLAHLLQKIIQRGRIPLSTLALEQMALSEHQLTDSVRQSEDPADLSYVTNDGTQRPLAIEPLLASLATRAPFRLDPEATLDGSRQSTSFDSQFEEDFLARWIPSAVGDEASHWFIPQASLDTLAEAYGLTEGGGGRRVDFLFSHPLGPPFVVELDGGEHATDGKEVDRIRDDLLSKCEIETIRVTNDELNVGHGPNLDAIKQKVEAVLTKAEEHRARASSWELVAAETIRGAQFQFCVIRLLNSGLLPLDGTEWRISLHGGRYPMLGALADLLNMARHLCHLYEISSPPPQIIAALDGERYLVSPSGDITALPPETPVEPDNAKVRFATDHSPFSDVAATNSDMDAIVRSASVPVTFAAADSSPGGRRLIRVDEFESVHDSLVVFLRQIFRKKQFREMQAEAIFNAMRGIDSVVLLPTGAGKSLIYQLSGILLPGVTLVVDPIVALIEDQVEGLYRFGIDRAAPLASSSDGPEARRRLLLRVERGDYLFLLLAPERLQIPEFRQTLRGLSEHSCVNLAVIDEAHCVSEWGHDFRPAYLNLAGSLREHASDIEGKAPPLLALTGTASRAVLRDLLTELHLDRNNTESLIRPASFDRKELRFNVAHAQPGKNEEAVLRGILNGLPRQFGRPPGDFFSPANDATASGLIFTHFVRGRSYSVAALQPLVKSATHSEVTTYSGRAPSAYQEASWQHEKRANASNFKENRIPILVATKAFGMGIDKPNVRYTIHMGLPPSMEAFYQEAGRAGRDGQVAICSIVFAEYNAERTNWLLDPSADLAEVRRRFAEVEKNKSANDDVTRALWFHLQSFSEVGDEVAACQEVITQLGNMESQQRLELPFPRSTERVRTEKALHRLLKVGILLDYEVDYGRQRYILDAAAMDRERWRKSLIDYIAASQPAKAPVYAEILDGIEASRPYDVATEFSRVLVEFTYDVVERSRRRMTLETVNMARHATDDQSVRQRLLDYLQEGFDADALHQLLERSYVDFGEWAGFFDNVENAIDAGELRGLCVRALESYPDHPGLLLTRGLSETLCSSAEWGVSTESVKAAIIRAVEGYGVLRESLADDLSPFLERAIDRFPAWQNLFVQVAIELARQHTQWSDEVVGTIIHDERITNYEARIRRAEYRLTQATDIVARNSDEAVDRYSRVPVGAVSENRMQVDG